MSGAIERCIDAAIYRAGMVDTAKEARAELAELRRKAEVLDWVLGEGTAAPVHRTFRRMVNMRLIDLRKESTP